MYGGGEFGVSRRQERERENIYMREQKGDLGIFSILSIIISKPCSEREVDVTTQGNKVPVLQQLNV